MIIVRTKQELNSVIKSGENSFFSVGPLADKIIKTRNVLKVSKAALIAAIAAIATGLILGPLTAGTSTLLTGASLVTITKIGGIPVAYLVIALGGATVVYGMHNNYDIEVFGSPGNLKVKLTRKEEN